MRVINTFILSRKARVALALVGQWVISSAVHAQTVPDAGSILRETQQSLELRPTPTVPTVSFPGEQTPPDQGFRIFVKNFRIIRATLFPEEELKALITQYTGRELSFSELQQAALKISEYYREKGYFARALLPQQTISDGIVTIVVIEGRLGAIQIDQAPEARLNKELVEQLILEQQKIGAPLRIEEAQRGLRLINELPGVQAQGTLVSGAKEGESNLVIKTEDGPLRTGMVLLDNQGVRATGLWRTTAYLGINNPSGNGDQVTLLGLAGVNNTYMRTGYTFRIGYQGLRLGVNASRLSYKLGDAFAALNADGRASTEGLTLSYPLLRKTGLNLNIAVNFDHKSLINNAAGSTTSNKRANVWNFSFSGDQVDALAGGGLTQFHTSLSLGRINYGLPSEIASDDLGPMARGHFSKWTFALSRLQKLTDHTGFYLNLTGQYAPHNLDSSEKFSLGGANGVRAYPSSEATGDLGWIVNAEIRHSLDDELQVVGFLDTGKIQINQTSYTGWNSATPNKPPRYRLSGIGVGLNYAKRNDYLIRGTLATPIGNNPGRDANGNDSDGRSDAFRVWIQAIKSL